MRTYGLCDFRQLKPFLSSVVWRALSFTGSPRIVGDRATHGNYSMYLEHPLHTAQGGLGFIGRAGRRAELRPPKAEALPPVPQNGTVFGDRSSEELRELKGGLDQPHLT